MNYKNLNSSHPREVTRALRRLWSLEVFDGEPLDDTPTINKTVVAFNELDANRMAGGPIARRPEPLFYVTWPPLDNPGSDIYRIDNTTDGPYGEPIKPTIPLPDQDEWDF